MALRQLTQQGSQGASLPVPSLEARAHREVLIMDVGRGGGEEERNSEPKAGSVERKGDKQKGFP